MFEKEQIVKVVSMDGWEKEFGVKKGDCGIVKSIHNDKSVAVVNPDWNSGYAVYFTPKHLEPTTPKQQKESMAEYVIEMIDNDDFSEDEIVEIYLALKKYMARHEP